MSVDLLHDKLPPVLHEQGCVAQTHDDAARFLSWVWTFIKSIDKAEAVAKAVLMDECRRRDNAWSWIK